MKKLIRTLGPIIDILMIPLTFFCSCWLKIVRIIGIERMKVSKYIFDTVGVFPIKDHYYEPLFNFKHLKYCQSEERRLPGIDMNIDKQISILKKFNFNDELLEFPLEKARSGEFYYHNSTFGCGDAEYLYNMIRRCKPNNIIEIGSGYSTLMSINAIKKNQEEDINYSCDHVCIEPFENTWLEDVSVTLIRSRLENVEVSLFESLQKNDILFIDSTHIIRPNSDVLIEYLQILPILKSGVLVHCHDIFTPRDYPYKWIINEVRFWNEQYLLEAFLYNSNFKIIGALNYLKHNYFELLSSKCPVLKKESNKEPGSFWIVRE